MNKVKRLIPVAGLALAVAVLTGCSGINSTQSVSPASFLLPGLIQNDRTPPGIPPLNDGAKQVALAGPLN